MSQLAPMPDRETGEPRPPEAPLYGSQSSSDHDSHARLPKPPKTCGPTLEAYVPAKSSAWISGGSAIVFMVIVMTLIEGFSWFQYWWVWVGIFAIGLLILFVLRGSFCAAGADWFRTQNSWVNTYELIEVKLNVTTKVELTLKDSGGRALSVDITDIQMNHRMWDLVYNGIRHSVENGSAKVNNYAKGVLRLP